MSESIPKWQWFHDYFAPTEVHLHGYKRMLYQKETPYQLLEIVDSPYFGRMLILDGDVQSSEKDEYIYHEALVQPAMVLHPNPRRVLVMGGGEGATLREVLRHKTVEKALMFDLDPEVVNACRELLPEWSAGAFDDPRTELYFGDARTLLFNYQGEPFDVIISDLTDPFQEGPSYLLFTREFFQLVREKLSPQGVFALQASLLRNLTYEMHRAICTTLKEVFPIVHSYFAYVQAFDTTWGFALASNSLDPREISPQEIDRRIFLRISGELKYYDGETHVSLFHLPKDIRALISQKGPIIEDKKPFWLPRKGNE
jgi:spermidine synthase